MILAVATFSSVRSGNRAARAAERSLLAGLRPVLVPSREDDPVERIDNDERIVIDLLYGDYEGGQRTIARFSVVAETERDGDARNASAVRTGMSMARIRGDRRVQFVRGALKAQ